MGRLVGAGSLGLVEPEQLWSEIVEPGLDDYMGPVFEDVCRDWVRRNPARLPFRPLRVGEWWEAPSQNPVDVVAAGGRGELLVAECKWGRVTAAHLNTLRERGATVAAELGGIQRVYAAVFTARGEIDEAVRREADAGDVLVFRAEDLA